MGSLTIRHNFTGETGYIIAVPRKTTAPLSDVICIIDGVAAQTRKAYPAPHSEVSLLIEGLDPVWYTVKFYRSAGGVALDEEILTLAGNALTGSLYPITKYEYIVDRGNSGTDPDWADPVDGDGGLRDERLAGQVYWVEERGTGSLLSTEITDRTDAGGGFDFTDTLKKFISGGVYFVSVIEKVDANPVASGNSDFSDIVELTADTDFDPGIHGGKHLVANWGSNIGIFTIPNLSLIPDCKFRLSTHGGTQSFVGIQLDAGDTVELRKSDLNVIWVGSGEEIDVTFKNNVMYVAKGPQGYLEVGQRVWGDSNTELNTVVRDGTQYTQASQPRLMQWIDEYSITTISEGTGAAQWNYSTVVNGITYYPNKSKFARDDVGGTIRVPDDRNRFIRALKYTDGVTSDTERMSQGAGGYQRDALKALPNINGVKDTGNNTIGPAASPLDSVNATGTEYDLTHYFPIGDGVDTRGENVGMIPLLKV